MVKVRVEKMISLFILALIIFAGILGRYDHYLTVNQQPYRNIVTGDPLLSNIDGYYYLSLARDLSVGSYEKVDSYRIIPDGAKRPATPPFLSVLTFLVAKLTSLPLIVVAVHIPVLLGMLLLVPLYLFARRWGDCFVAYSTMALAITAVSYRARTSYAFFDTDCLVVTVALFCAYFFMRFALCMTRERYYYCGAGFSSYLLYLWVWDTAPAVVTLLALLPFFFAVAFCYRPPKLEALVFISALLSVFAIFYSVAGLESIVDLPRSLMGKVSYVIASGSAPYPNTAIGNMEQQVSPLTVLAQRNSYNIVMFCLSLSGFALMIIRRVREVIFLLPVTVVGCLAVFKANRFEIFLLPVLALGFGYLIATVVTWSSNRMRWVVRMASAVLVFIISCLQLKYFISNENFFSNKVVYGMEKVADHTPENAVVWSWWNIGHPLVYWSKRSTLTDGKHHGPRRVNMIGLPLAAHSFRFAANYMHFYASRGMSGLDQFRDYFSLSADDAIAALRDILADGPEKGAICLQSLLRGKGIERQSDVDRWLSFFYPNIERPQYLFLHNRMMLLESWIYWYGTWSPGLRSGKLSLPTARYKSFYKDSNDRPIFKSLNINFYDGTVTPDFVKGKVYIDTLVVTGINDSIFYNYSTKESCRENKISYADSFEPVGQLLQLSKMSGCYTLDIYEPDHYALLLDKSKSQMIINRLFWRKNDYDRNYFFPVDLSTPHYQLWQVTADKLSH